MTTHEFHIRRNILKDTVKEGIIVLAANHVLARNYNANVLPFRQDSTFFYYTGLNNPEMFCILDCDEGKDYLVGRESSIEDTIWSGPQKSLMKYAEQTGLNQVIEIDQLPSLLSKVKKEGRQIHYLKPYTSERKLKLAELLGTAIEIIDKDVSVQLINAIIAQRSIKSDAEVAEIEQALNLATGPMHIKAMQMAKPGIKENEIVAEMSRIAILNRMEYAYSPICSIRGETLHNEVHLNTLKNNQLLLVDAGVESVNHYSSDITRTTPVGGKFSQQQNEIYSIVLDAQLKAIEIIKPGVKNRDVHLEVARHMADGLKSLGLLKGDVNELVEKGAHALFFPHGLGHMMGLDVHDMEDFGEDLVGYDENTKRSSQFGTAYLRMGKELSEGYVITVEPGLYFIPALISQWEKEKKYKEFINYSKLHTYYDFGGVRIEDNLLITSYGNRVLGSPIPKTINEIETLCSE